MDPRRDDPFFVERDYEPIQPRGRDIRGLLRKLWAPIAVVVGLAIKFGAFTIKFFGLFISIGGYALIWGLPFALGFVGMILIHELGHFVEARRQGLRPSLPVFIPFLGAYVAIKNAPDDPMRNALVSAAGPIAGGLAAAGVLVAGEATDRNFFVALAFTGFLLNLINLLPVPPLDGGFLVNAFRRLRREPGGGGRSLLVLALYVGIAGALALGMWAAHVPQDRL